MVPLATGTGCIVYYHYMTNLSHLVQKCTSVELRLSQYAHSPTPGGRGRTSRTSSGRNFRPDVPVQAGPSLMWPAGPDRTSGPVRFRPDASGVRSFPNDVMTHGIPAHLNASLRGLTNMNSNVCNKFTTSPLPVDNMTCVMERPVILMNMNRPHDAKHDALMFLPRAW